MGIDKCLGVKNAKNYNCLEMFFQIYFLSENCINSFTL